MVREVRRKGKELFNIYLVLIYFCKCVMTSLGVGVCTCVCRCRQRPGRGSQSPWSWSYSQLRAVYPIYPEAHSASFQPFVSLASDEMELGILGQLTGLWGPGITAILTVNERSKRIQDEN